jgi:hypothetical protein
MNATGYRGVRKSTDAWRAKPYFARVKLGEIEVYSERCATVIGAAMAYDRIARELHGSAAVLNFPVPAFPSTNSRGGLRSREQFNSRFSRGD